MGSKRIRDIIMKYVCASDSLRPGQLDRLISTIKDETPSKEKSIVQSHIGCKIIQAEPMDEDISRISDGSPPRVVTMV